MDKERTHVKEVQIIDASEKKLNRVEVMFAAIATKASNSSSPASNHNTSKDTKNGTRMICCYTTVHGSKCLYLLTGNLCNTSKDIIVCQICEKFQPFGKASKDVHRLADESFKSEFDQQKKQYRWTDPFSINVKSNMPGVKYVVHVPYNGNNVQKMLHCVKDLKVKGLSMPLLGVDEGR